MPGGFLVEPDRSASLDREKIMSDALAAMRRSVVLGFVALIGVVGSGQAWAACTQSDLTGRFQVYVDRAGPEGGGWSYCRIRVDSNGDIRIGTNCTDLDETGRQVTGTVQGGRLTTASSCRVKGEIDASVCGNARVADWISLSNAFFSRDKDTIVGVGEDCDGAAVTFTIIRR